MTSPLFPVSGLLLRTPLWPFTDRRPAAELLQLNELRLAIFLASTDFYRALESKAFDYQALTDRQRLSLEKYINRMRFRPTPFGLFSGVSAMRWSDEGNIRVDESGAAQLHLFPDHSLSAAIAFHRGSSPQTVYELNPTLYFAGREFRFIKSEPTEGTRLHFLLESFEANPLTRKLCKWIAKEARTKKEILSFLQAATSCTGEEASGYLDFLGDAQILRPFHGLNVIGKDYFLRERAQHPDLARAWEKVIPANRNVNQTADRIPQLRQLAQELDQQFPGSSVKNCFYAGTVRQASGGLPRRYQKELEAALAALTKISPTTAPPLLTQFIKDFTERFEARKIPLMEALDPETGVGYGPFAGGNTPEGLLKTIDFSRPKEDQPAFNWSNVHRLLLSKWQALTPADPIIRIHEQDIAGLPLPAETLAPGLSVLFRITGQGLLVESAGGVSAPALAGRFSLFSESLHKIAQDAAAQECATNPGVIFADIGQLSDRHTDNINRRLHIYEYEIPINSSSLLPRERQIRPSDLLVSVAGGTVTLESAQHKKTIIPRLTTAYNFRHNHLALFRFLCDLQYQGVQSDLSFDLETWFPGMEYYPRIQYQQTILSPAKWKIQNEVDKESAHNLRRKLNLPRQILLTRADQQLTFDLEQLTDQKMFDNCIAGMTSFTLQEALLPDADSPIISTKTGAPLTGQLIAMFVNRQPVYLPRAFVPPVKARNRVFVPGSQWLYYKIYCTPAGADSILTERIAPVLEKLSDLAPFEWFFVRYTDPGHHIRLRVRIPEEETGRVMTLFKKQFSGLVRDRLIREIQTATYSRELERYGPGLIDRVEACSFASSQLVLGFLQRHPDGGTPRDRFCLNAYHFILGHLVPAGEQLAFLAGRSDAFFQEFGGDKKLQVSLDALYRQQKRALFSEVQADEINAYLSGPNWAFFQATIGEIAEKTGDLTAARRLDLASDLIHMHVNRVYPEQQRKQELALYYCLYKYHLALKGMAKQKAPALAIATVCCITMKFNFVPYILMFMN